MFQVILYGFIAAGMLLVGVVFGLTFKLKQSTIARIMAFGAGVLVCALTFGLMEQAFRHGGFDAVIIGFLIGGLVFIGGDYLVHLKGGRRYKRKPLMQPVNDSGSGKAMMLGALLDGVPESMALGIAIAGGASTGLLMLCAVAISSFPEGLSSVEGLVKEGFSKKQLYAMWIGVTIILTVITVASFYYLPKVDGNSLGVIEAFAAGAILAMLADTMMPEAFEEGGFTIGMLTVLGFLTAFVISRF